MEPPDRPLDFDDLCRNILHPEDRDATEAAIRAAVAGEKSYDLAFRVVHPDGSVRHIKSNAQVLRDGQGRAVRIIGINQDRTRQVEAEPNSAACRPNCSTRRSWRASAAWPGAWPTT